MKLDCYYGFGFFVMNHWVLFIVSYFEFITWNCYCYVDCHTFCFMGKFCGRLVFVCCLVWLLICSTTHNSI